MTNDQLKSFLNSKFLQYNTREFIQTDPISIPHQFSKKEDIEISGFLAAIISWGQRKTILNNANQLMEWMDWAPYDFIINATDPELIKFINFKHRTFNGWDCVTFIKALQNIYRNHDGLKGIFLSKNDIKEGIVNLKKIFFELPHLERTRKHIADPLKGSSAKRLNMFLRWMVRRDNSGVDFGIWKSIKSSQLYCPLDVHSGHVARKLGLLKRKQNDWKAVEELTESLRKFDPDDPVKFDYALFGLGVFEKFS